MTMQQSDVVEVAARLEYNGVEDMVNVFQFQKTDVPAVSDALGMADIIAFLEAVYTTINTFMPLIHLYRDLTARNVTQGTVLGTFPWATLTAGTSVQDALPPGVAVMSAFSTGVPRVILKKYWPGVDESTNRTDGAFGTGLMTAIGTMNAGLLVPYVGANSTWQYGYLSPKTASFLTPVAAVVTDIPAYQRRRKQGRGV